MDIFRWINETSAPEPRTTEALIYEHMASQSGESLPIVYQPFDADNRGHWRDRGAALDFALATRAEGRRVLDFGPGDGWPSLIIAPFVGEVVGLEGSRRRREVCAANAARLGIANARFEVYEPGTALPFEDASFDAVVAASSVEQSPDPQATLAEFYRVLRPGGRARLSYEGLGAYRGGHEREAWLWSAGENLTRLVLYDRDIEGEQAVQVVMKLALPKEALAAALGASGRDVEVTDITVARLEALRPAIVDAGICTTHHPSCATLLRWLREIGFSEAQPSHDGMRIAGGVFDHLPPGQRPATLEAIDAYLRPIVAAAVDLAAPAALDPMITATK
jgi:SAM-dependent methyltransferase